jgi:DNA polymerase-3 subunit epsilon
MTLKTTDCNFTAIDFETANHYRKSACSIGMVRVEDGKIVDEFYSLIKPDPYEFNPIQVKIHGINRLMCENESAFDDLWPSIKPWIDGQLVIAHNVSFEKSVLRHLFEAHGIQALIKDFLCTYYMSQVYLHHLKSHKLNNIYFDLFNKPLNHHNALDDARACAEVALHVIHKWEPPNFPKMVAALYEEPVEHRASNKPVPFAQLVPDQGFEEMTALKGKNFTFSGDLSCFSKDEAAQFVINYGGKANENVTRSTTHLVIGQYDAQYEENHQSRKYKRAQEYNTKGCNIEIMGCNDFMDLVNAMKDVNKDSNAYTPIGR